MAWPSSLQLALKEWSVVCDALADGRQMILLRKGGIYESSGEFEVEHREFLLFPTYVHQNTDMLKPSAREELLKRDTEPTEVAVSAAATVSDIILLKNREQMNKIDDEHLWTAPLIDMRFNYRADNPLYLLILRAYRLHQPVTVANTPAYAGCKSWVPLDHEIAIGDALPVLDDVKFDLRRQSILQRIA